jgi:hypothetical protein
MAHFLTGGQPTSLIEVGTGSQIQVQLWGDGPSGERLDVSPSDPTIFRVDEISASFGRDLRTFTLHALRQGSARLYARVGAGGAIWADTRVMVGFNSLNRYYHGTNSTIADLLTTVDLTPMVIPTVLVTSFDWTDYTDFGKGFYVHLEANKAMAYEWARRRFSSDWAVVEFIATPAEIAAVAPNALVYQNKADRPSNSPQPITVTTTRVQVCPIPQLLPCLRVTVERQTTTPSTRTLSWLEFVEYNRHIDRTHALIARPNDRDWTGSYSSIRGPIWVPRDSGYPVGLPVFPDSLHQLNWGLEGMVMLNAAEAKVRRFKFSAQNEGLFPPPGAARAARSATP